MPILKFEISTLYSTVSLVYNDSTIILFDGENGQCVKFIERLQSYNPKLKTKLIYNSKFTDKKVYSFLER